jgi:D-xylose transport system permease protein
VNLPEIDPRLVGSGPGVRGAVAAFRRRISQGELGTLPVIIGLVVIWGVFQYKNSRFLSAGNVTNLMLQIAAVGLISVGVVLVLLLGEIDLSVGIVSGLGAAVMAVLNVKHGVSAPVALLAGLGTGVVIGLFQGLVITRLHVPSFVVTLAGFIGWQGVLLQVLGTTGTINLQPNVITQLTTTFFSHAVGWILAVVAIAVYLAAQLLEFRRRGTAGLRPRPPQIIAFRTATTAVPLLVLVAVVNRDRGLPLAAVILVGFVLLFDIITTRTVYGRHIFAVGGNAEAARRAGISVANVQLSVFVLASTMAAAGGILGASRLIAVNQSSGGGDLLLNAIAAAVIGGTSLFGGRGTVWAALLGALVIGSISNGMDLLAYSSPIKFIVTGGVLLVAAAIDATARRGRASAGVA